jgi:hypothetical protein
MRFALILLALLSGSASAPSLETRARQLLADIVAGNYEAAAKDFNAQMMAGLPPAKLKEVFERQIAPHVGAFQSAGDAEVSNGTVTLPVKFEKAAANFVVVFDEAGKVAGLWIRPPAEPPPAETRFADYKTKTSLQLPFDGEWFVFWGGRTYEQNYHVITVDQRFAYDFVVNRNGWTHSGDAKKLASYYAWDAPIRAPAAGVVTESVDGFADNIPGNTDPFAPAGNHIVIDHGNGEYSLLAHFRKGSVVPKTGDRVKQGDVVGHCGNSGNTSEPHLHYHLQNGPKFGGAEGLPAQFVNYVANGKKVKRGEPVRGERIKRDTPRSR